jgi:hypothetical protein
MVRDRHRQVGHLVGIQPTGIIGTLPLSWSLQNFVVSTRVRLSGPDDLVGERGEAVTNGPGVDET